MNKIDVPEARKAAAALAQLPRAPEGAAPGPADLGRHRRGARRAPRRRGADRSSAPARRPAPPGPGASSARGGQGVSRDAPRRRRPGCRCWAAPTSCSPARKARIDQVVAQPHPHAHRGDGGLLRPAERERGAAHLRRLRRAGGARGRGADEGLRPQQEDQPERRQVARRDALALDRASASRRCGRAASPSTPPTSAPAAKPSASSASPARWRSSSATSSAACRTRRWRSPTPATPSPCAASCSRSTSRWPRPSPSGRRCACARRSAARTATLRRDEAEALRDRFYVLAVKQRARIAKAERVAARAVGGRAARRARAAGAAGSEE